MTVDWMPDIDGWVKTAAHSSRRGVKPTVLIYHWTGGWREAKQVAAIDYQRKRNRVSAHFTIGRAGEVIQSVPLSRAAWHVGGGRFMGLGGSLNLHSIGVEVCNRGFLRGNGADEERILLNDGFPTKLKHANPRCRRDVWEEYTEHQEDAIQGLTDELFRLVPSLEYITGHEDVLNSYIGNAKGAKLDPGPAFPWDYVSWPGKVARYDYEERDWLVVDYG